MRNQPTVQGPPLGEAPPEADPRAEHGAWLAWVLHQVGVPAVADAVADLSPGQVVSLGGGKDATTFLVRRPGGDLVVKLNDHGLEAEAAALRAWRQHTSRVPEVLGAGTVPTGRSRPVRYLVLSALVGDGGGVAETAEQTLTRSPAAARRLGRELGGLLHTLHQARCPAGFGNFADSPGAERSYGTWGGYLEDFFRQHADHVRSLGVTRGQIERVRAVIRRCVSVAEARYLHGDVSIRNIAVHSDDPVRISLFDPNPLCGDPSWDIAPIANNAEFSERRQRRGRGEPGTLTRDRELLAGFWETYPHRVPEESLLAGRLVQAVLQAEHRAQAAEDGETDDVDVDVTREFIRDVVDRMAT